MFSTTGAALLALQLEYSSAAASKILTTSTHYALLVQTIQTPRTPRRRSERNYLLDTMIRKTRRSAALLKLRFALMCLLLLFELNL